MTFDNLKVNNCGDGYAPLLINSITHNVTLNANKITTKINGKDTYTGGTAVASSLIGTTGTKKAKRLNMTFQNIVLPDKKAEGSTGIFSHATLLESFSYDKNDNTSGASYNFYKADDWSDTTHKHEVTYGQEQSIQIFRNGIMMKIHMETPQVWFMITVLTKAFLRLHILNMYVKGIIRKSVNMKSGLTRE